MIACYQKKMQHFSGFCIEKRDLLYTILNIILNIEKHYKDFCRCNGNILCPPCTVANTYQNKQNSLFENCFDFDFIHEVGVQLNDSLSFLHKDMSHFICKIIHDCFHFEHKCFSLDRFAKWI